MKYLQPSFSTAAPGDQQYRDNWDRIFGKKETALKYEVEVPETYLYNTKTGDALEYQTLESQVREFHTVFGQPILETPTVPADDRVKLRLKLIAEEFTELLEATMFTGFMYAESVSSKDLYVGEILESFIRTEDTRVDLVKTADALGDLMYVIQGMALELGIDLPAVLAEIHRANLSKAGPDGKPVYNEIGKVTKGPNYSPPDIAKVLNVGR